MQCYVHDLTHRMPVFQLPYLCDTSLSMHVNIYKPVLVLSSNTTHAFFLPPGFHGKSVGENRRRFTYSHITHGLVWFFFSSPPRWISIYLPLTYV